MAAERSFLFVPGDRPERFSKALSSGADRVIIDLEDAVAPDAKVVARENLVRWLGSADARDIFVRINAVTTPWHDDDISALVQLPARSRIDAAESRSECHRGNARKNAGGCTAVRLD